MDSFQQPAFCFSMPTDDFDPNQVPTDGEQYLQCVIYERIKCPAVVVKPLMRTEQKSSPSVWDQYAAEVWFGILVHTWMEEFSYWH